MSNCTEGISSDYDIPPSSSWAPFQKVKLYNIPDPIFEQYNRAQVTTIMGLFAELHHAWVAIDNALYIWDYTSPNPQLIGFEDQPHNINAVKLAKPRPGVFLPSITHVLVISTAAEVMLLGAGYDSTAPEPQITLYQTGMSTLIRGLDIQVFASSDSTGRIFFGGNSDNDVHELVYQQEERWFRGGCYRVNHTSPRFGTIGALAAHLTLHPKPFERVVQMVVDDSRKLLYTLSSLSTIRVFLMKPNSSLVLAITKPALDIYSNIGHIITSNETLNAKVRIVSISPIPAGEASRYHLMATTATGYRIYLSATGSYSWTALPNGAPTSMQAHHVKTPPLDHPPTPATMLNTGFHTRFQSSVASKVPIRSLVPTRLATRFPPGFFFCFVSKDPSGKSDDLFISAPDSGRIARSQETAIQGKASESAMWLPLGSKTEDIGLCSPLPVSANSGFGNELSVQFDHPTTEIAILTNSGVHVIRRRRLVDVFASLVRRGGGDEGLEGEIRNFIRTYGRSETLATALAVACGQGMDLSSDSRLSQINDAHVLDLARKVFIEYGGRPTMNENAVADNATLAIDAILPSPRHAGIALYISRLLRSIWKKEIAKVDKGANGAPVISTTVKSSKLREVQRDLSALQDFFKANRTFIEGLSGPEALARVSSRQEEVALQAEHRALHSLAQLVSHTIEAISFVLVLFDEKFDEIVGTLPEGSKQRFFTLTFQELFSTSKGHDVAKELIKSIVNKNIAKGSNVETVADALRRRCGSFCSAEDVLIFKAQELLKRASEAGANSELGRNLLNESLRLFQQVADSLSMDYLVSAVDNYINCQFFAGAIQLSLTVAARSDRANLAFSWIVDGRPENVRHLSSSSPFSGLCRFADLFFQDNRKEYFYFRKQCYDLISKVILAVDDLAATDPEIVDGHLTTIAKRKNEAYAVTSDSTDEVFLTSLYDWYLEQGWSDRLLQASSPFVVKYLQRKSIDDVSHADLLWRFYAQSERFFEAATVQYRLAQSAFTLPLARRIEYLGRARANASTFTHGVSRQSRQQLLQDISNLLEVANIQDDILERIKEDTRIDERQKPDIVREVDGPIMDITVVSVLLCCFLAWTPADHLFLQLFNKYADSASYYDICLEIFYAADYRVSAFIKTTWERLLQDVHEKAVQRGTPQPYEAVIDKVRSLGGRLRMSPTVFPVSMLVPMLERYALEHQRRTALTSTWIVDLFLDLGVPDETLYGVLELMYYNDEAPFQGPNRSFIGMDLVYLIERWFHESTRLGGNVFGSSVLAERVLETLQLLQQGGLPPMQMDLAQALQMRITQILQ